MTCAPGTAIGDYRVLEPIGAGGSGEVYKAEHVLTRRIEALKLLTQASHTEEDEQRRLREIQLQASLRHPHIAAVYHAFRTPYGPALVMELVEGEPLDKMLARGRIPPGAGTGYILETLAALEYAHEHGIIHRDVKPGNILVDRDGMVKLTDFGLAVRLNAPQLTHSGIFAGSPYYMSPEQVVGLSPVDARSDIYSVGVVLYEVATGVRPFEDESAFQIMLQHRDCAPTPPREKAPEIGRALNDVILKALAKDPARRFQSAADFRTALAQATASKPGARRKGGRIGAIAATLVCAVGGAAMVAGNYTEYPPPPPPPHAAAPVRPAPLPEPAPAPKPVRKRIAVPAHKLPEHKPETARSVILRERPRVAAAAPVEPYVQPPPEARPVPPEPVVASDAGPPVKRAEPAESDLPPAAPVSKPEKKRRHVLWRALGRIVHPLK